MKQKDIPKRLAFIREAEQLKNVLRSAHTSSGRQESTAEHSWRLCLLALALEDRLAHLDFAKVLQLCIVHDLGEAISGDIPAIAQTADSNKSEQEKQDLLTLLSPLPAFLQKALFSLWEEYEEASSPEARAVKALDKIETLIQHNQGTNPPDFDYRFNLTHGSQYTSNDPLFAEIRALIDADTAVHADKNSL
ncbi:HD domain-containing protein [Oxalobacter vibrioformis]|uniref:5'-deoxynucleotidase n=1 Tax=Oxalobacter vibrioformis TaxID=933080 RepID=A0A9E9LZ04_9BURK|nr:HD domain-containing protein [Oxalobacter vibrioformis]WAW11342.1 HD domain-containing protein [Oxalobacter vibrioformis]